MLEVIKRDNAIVDFQLDRISHVIKSAFDATKMLYNADIINLLALRVTADFQPRIQEGKIHVEDVQDSVEHVLEQSGYTEAAKAFILYRKNREKLRNMKSTILDYKEIVDSYVREEDWRVKEDLFYIILVQLQQIIGYLKFMMQKLQMHIEVLTFIFMICLC